MSDAYHSALTSQIPPTGYTLRGGKPATGLASRCLLRSRFKVVFMFKRKIRAGQVATASGRQMYAARRQKPAPQCSWCWW